MARTYIGLIAFAASIVCILNPSARAQSMARDTLDPWHDKDLAITFDHPIEEMQGHASNAPSDSQVFWWDSFGRVRLDRNDPNSPFIAYRILTMDVGTDSRYIASTMDDLTLAAGLHLGQVAGWNITTILGAGYTGTHPFVNEKGTFGVGDLMAEHSLNADTSLVLAVDYAGDGGFLPDIPLPGFAFVHQSKTLDYTLGFPLNRVNWRPIDKLEISAAYTVPYTAKLDAEYRIQPHVGVYGLAENFFQGFVERGQDSTDRQFYQMRRVEAGVRIVFDPWVDVGVGIGYAFDQTFSRGFDIRDMQAFSRISNEPYIALVLRGSF